MKVFLAPRGFCADVIRAVDTVEQALVENLNEVPTNSVTIFSAHGVGKEVEAETHQRGLQVLDATCPLVTKVHNHGCQYAAKGYQVILIGEPDHPEDQD
ncbi:hypothetical protein [Pseudomonas frederiksbergensis]|uniref:hypothetical protein n=1 Tax=Pseudomonas frederiksbergensis TaxID=104087 RepID=UPI003D962D0B